jgi:DNA-binding CsgD family transcriptional regulator
MTRPLYVLESVLHAATVARRLARDGWTVHEGFALPDEPWDVTPARVVLVGLVDDTASAADAVLAAARGAGVVATTEPGCPDVAAVLLADLERIGPVSRDADRPAKPPAGDTDPLPLTEEQRTLLDRLAAGDSIAAAADAEFLSLRTANRRIAQARAALGVRTTRQAVVEYVRRRDR